MIKNITLLIIGLCLCNMLQAQPEVNYDENAIKPYVLPEVLNMENGNKVKNVSDWEQKRRPEILEIYTDQVFGKVPDGVSNAFDVEVLEESKSAFNGNAERRQVALVFKRNGKEVRANVLLYLPKGVASPPIFVGYNFKGNHTTISDPAVLISETWLQLNAGKSVEESRGERTSRWSIDRIISSGFGIATIYYEDVDPDINDLSDGIHSLFYKNNQARPSENEWGSLAGWAWGMSRVVDYLKTDISLSSSKMIAFGHSRLGKAALWAGATDDRFDLIVSNDSGCGGAALSRRKFGETISIINTSFPHWFNTNFKQYNGKEENLPVDQHMLIALMAPRPVYIASAQDDTWADPHGEYLSGYHASPVYGLYSKKGLSSKYQPAANRPNLEGAVGYHMRTGGHDVKDYDWEQYIAFAKKNLNY
jgi:hypothetical protein